MRDQGEGGEVQAMPSLMNSGKNITPEANHNEGDGEDRENDRYPRRGTGYSVGVSEEETRTGSYHSRLECDQGRGIHHLDERGKDLLFVPGDEGMDMTTDGGEDLFTNDRSSSKSHYRVEDLNQSMKRKPKYVSEVCSDNIQFRDEEANLLQLRKAV